MLRCKKCGTPVEEGDKFCTACGSLQKHERKEDTQNTRENTIRLADSEREEVDYQNEEGLKRKRKVMLGILAITSVVIFLASYTVYIIANPKSTASKKLVSIKGISSNKEQSSNNTNNIASADPQKTQDDVNSSSTTNNNNTYNNTDKNSDTNDNSTSGVIWQGDNSYDSNDNTNDNVTIKAKDNSYIFPDSSTRLMTKQELEGYDEKALELGIAEIFARHGYEFKGDYKSYFDNKDWYTPNASFKGYPNQLSSIERVNIKTMIAAGGKNLVDKGKQDISNAKDKIIKKKVQIDEKETSY
ncbi:MAG: YARHG domain-containing protein [Bacillota bacterium]|nr:YARHG domain-containing protein [Bacillota bacterium]